MNTLVIGLGNPILGDDGVGWRVAEGVIHRLPEAFPEPDAAPEIDCLSLGGLSLMERMIGYAQVILVDAISTGASPAGTITVFPLEALPNRAAGHLASAHDTSLQNALQVGRSMDACLPEVVMIVAVEAQTLYEFSEALTPPVAAAVPRAVQAVMDLLLNNGLQDSRSTDPQEA